LPFRRDPGARVSVVGHDELQLQREAVRAVAETLRSGRPASLEGELASDAELQALLADLVALHDFVLAMSRGDLEQSLSVKGNTAGALKALHASLCHLAWQTQRVASGDLSQRVDFMGDFAESFNAMVLALERSRRELDDRNTLLDAQNRLLQEMAATDSLTGLFNRRKFDELTQREIERACRYSRPFSVMMLDLDHFKAVNDEFGHRAGDLALIQVAAVARDTVRSVDSVARWGGEEFIVLLPEVGLTGATRAAERICDAIREAHVVGGMTASVGVAEYRSGETAEELLSRVDEALYRAKRTGRDRIVIAG
jgi:diguanylate cyclase (GGDEF)-like protein